MSNLISYLQNKNNLEELQQKCFVCVVDNVVVANITNIQINMDNTLVPVILPDWQTFLKILQSPNHIFIERSIPIFPGTIWNGQDFIANEEQISEDNTLNDVYIKINNSCIYHEGNTWIVIKEYTMYIIELLIDYLNKNPQLEINIIINSKKTISFDNNNNKIIRIFLNVEQTIVEDTYFILNKEPVSKIPFNGKQYTVYMEMIDDFQQNDIIFEYSKPNIKNIEISGLYPDLLTKLQYISACVYKNVIMTTISKTVNTLTLFGEDSNITTRRSQKLQEINNLLDNHRNETSCFGDELKTLLENTKILINIHRSDYENTFEEIRVLPALQQRVLVVSEISPLTELVPFNPLIIWATYDNIVQKTKEVLDNYETYYNSIFTQQNINLLNNLHNQNIINISNKLNEFIVN
jgi:hypothetical protein